MGLRLGSESRMVSSCEGRKVCTTEREWKGRRGGGERLPKECVLASIGGDWR